LHSDTKFMMLLISLQIHIIMIYTNSSTLNLTSLLTDNFHNKLFINANCT